MKRQLLFIALMAASSQISPWYGHGHHGYWGGGPRVGFGISVGGPGYGYYGPGYDYGYYPYSPVDAVVNTAGNIMVASAIENSSRNNQRSEDPNKRRRSEIAGKIYDKQGELDALPANSSAIKAKKEEIKKLKSQKDSLR
jgi:hypothetical protein